MPKHNAYNAYMYHARNDHIRPMTALIAGLLVILDMLTDSAGVKLAHVRIPPAVPTA